MMDTIRALFSSKKFVASIFAALVWGLGKIGFDIDVETLYGLVSPILAYVLGQSIADIGKEKAIVEGVDGPVPGLGNGND